MKIIEVKSSNFIQSTKGSGVRLGLVVKRDAVLIKVITDGIIDGEKHMSWCNC